MIITKKKISLSVFGIIFIAVGIFIMQGIFDYFDYRKAVQAASAMPWQDGGVITLVRPLCILDSPPPPAVPVTCAISCPLATLALGPTCVSAIEIDVQGQNGSTFIAAPIGFIYKGGGVYPKVGDQFIAGGSSPANPWIIGIPGSSISRIQKLVDSFKLIIAGIKE